MKKILLIVLFASFALLAVAGAETEDKSDFTFGFTERFRLVTWDNVIALSDSVEGNTFTRHRTSLSLKWTPSADIELFAKLTNEFRYYFKPDDREFDIHEVIFDNLYLKWKNMFDAGLTLTLGRQNIMLDEGFVVMDGHPLDGSRSIYFNAARLDWKFREHGNLTLFYSYQPETDDILPVINPLDQALIEKPEEGLGAYFKNRFGKTDVSLYYILKNIDATESSSFDSEINTLGLRATLPLPGKFAVTTEGAYQWGTRGEADIAAYGGYIYLDYNTGWKAPLPVKLTAGGVYLSGDDQTTPEWEAWDPLFSRWPKWSESYIYAMIIEQGVAYWSNFTSLYLKMNFKITNDINLDVSYNRLGAAEEILTEKAYPGGTGTTRGDLFITKLNVKFSKSLSGHILWEGFAPGDFYFADATGYNWFRCELLYRF